MYKIAIIQNVTPNDHRAVYIDGFVRYLNREKFDPTVILQKTNDPLQFSDINYNINYLDGSTYSPTGQIKFIYNSFKKLRKEDYNIIHAINPFSSMITPFILNKLRIKKYKIIYDIRGLWVEFGVHAGYFPAMLKYLLDWIDIYLMNRCDRIIAISNMMKKVLIEKGISQEILILQYIL